MTRFDDDTAVREAGAAVYEGRVDPAWWIDRGPNGGYLASIILNAMLHRLDDPARAPRSLTVHYMRPPAEGAVRVETNVERAGRRLATLSARMFQEDRPIAAALATLSTPWDGIEYHDATMRTSRSPTTSRR